MAQEHRGSESGRVGVLWSQTGVTAVIEESQLKGTLLALEEINDAGGVDGRELVPIIYDPASEPANLAHLAKHAMNKRLPIGKVASTIIDANELLGYHVSRRLDSVIGSVPVAIRDRSHRRQRRR